MTDLLSIVQQDTRLKRVASTNGGEHHGPCPFCGGRDRFRVQPEEDFWACRKCSRDGDTIAYLVDTGRMTKGEAWKARQEDGIGGLGPALASKATPKPKPAKLAPPEAWQRRGRAFCAECMAALWSDAGERARAWLRGRGLTDATIRAAGLGLNDCEQYNAPEAWGLTGKKVWLPRGVVIPWEVRGKLWRVNIRRPAGHPKYIGPRGFVSTLYQGGSLPARTVALVEGEFDALLLNQECGDLVTAVATGSVTGARAVRWVGKLALCDTVLLAFDRDQAGDKATTWWADVLEQNARPWRPFWGDVGQMYQDGVDLRAWLACAPPGDVPRAVPGGDGFTFPLRLQIPAERATMPGLAVPAGRWERQSDGAIVATFESIEELTWCASLARVR